MVAGLDTARNLPVDKVRCSVHFSKQVGQQLAQFLFRHRDVDIQCLGAGVKAVEVVLHQIHLAVGTDCRVIHAVAEEVYPVIERNRQFFRRADFTVIVCKCFHRSFLPDFVVYRGPFTPNFNSMTLLMTSTQLSKPMAALSRQRS